MSADEPLSGLDPLVTILELSEEYKFANLFRIMKARLRYRRFDGSMSEPITRINFERGDSVGILLYNPQKDTVVLVKQFRYPVYAGLDPGEQAGPKAEKAWILEIVAGMVDAGLSVVEVANKELLEEAGIEVSGNKRLIATVYPSPGGTSERIPIYLAEVDQFSRVAEGGGIAHEHEDIQIKDVPFSQALAMVRSGEISDAKTIIALQHLALLKADGRYAYA